MYRYYSLGLTHFSAIVFSYRSNASPTFFSFHSLTCGSPLVNLTSPLIPMQSLTIPTLIACQANMWHDAGHHTWGVE